MLSCNILENRCTMLSAVHLNLVVPPDERHSVLGHKHIWYCHMRRVPLCHVSVLSEVMPVKLI